MLGPKYFLHTSSKKVNNSRCVRKGKGGREGGSGGTDKGESYTHKHSTAHAHTNACRTCTPLTHALTLAHTHFHLHLHSQSHSLTHSHTQEEKVKELHETILPPLLQQLNYMVETNNFAKGWIWGDKVYTYAEREEGGVCG